MSIRSAVLVSTTNTCASSMLLRQSGEASLHFCCYRAICPITTPVTEALTTVSVLRSRRSLFEDSAGGCGVVDARHTCSSTLDVLRQRQEDSGPMVGVPYNVYAPSILVVWCRRDGRCHNKRSLFPFTANLMSTWYCVCSRNKDNASAASWPPNGAFIVPSALLAVDSWKAAPELVALTVYLRPDPHWREA